MAHNHHSNPCFACRLTLPMVLACVGGGFSPLEAASIVEQVESVAQRVRAHRFHPIKDGFTDDAKLGKHGIADLDDVGWKVRTLAVRDLVRLGREAVPHVTALLKDGNPHVREDTSRWRSGNVGTRRSLATPSGCDTGTDACSTSTRESRCPASRG